MNPYLNSYVAPPGLTHPWIDFQGLAPLAKLCRRSAAILLVVLILGLVTTPAIAAEPSIRDVSRHGIEIGAANTIVIDGDDLGSAPRLLLPFPARQELKPGATDKRATFEIAPDAAAIPGYYQLRVASEGGVTLPIVVAHDRLPQRAFAPTVEQLPVALDGALGGSTVLETRFQGKAGQKVSVEVEAQRLGSKLRPIVHLYNARRRQLAWSWGTAALAGDSRIDATLPADGEFIVALHDAEYAVPGPGFFRLKIGEWDAVDQVFPPVVAPGRNQTLELIGPSSLRHVELAGGSASGVLPIGWPGEGRWSGPQPYVTVGTHAEVVEDVRRAGVRGAGFSRLTGGASEGATDEPPKGGTTSGGTTSEPQDLPAAPVGVSGRLATPYETDRYRITVNPGSKLRLEVFAERYGSPIDTALVVANTSGAVLASAEDSPGTIDPVVEFVVPEKTDAVIISVVDALGRGSARGIYRLAIEPQDQTALLPEYRLSTSLSRISLPGGGRVVAPVWIERRGYPGSIEIAAAGLPENVKLAGTAIPEAAEGTLITIERGDAASSAALLSWSGRDASGGSRPVSISGHPLERVAPWLATEIAMAPSTAKAAEFQLDWRNLPSDAGIVLGGRLAMPIKLVRTATEGVVRLTPISSQPLRIVNGQPDPNRALRAERPVELAANILEGEVALLVPAELPSPVYDVSVLAELLSADRQKVLAAAYAPVRRLAVRSPLAVQLAGAARIEVPLDPKQGATVKIAGKIERRDGQTGDVQVTLTGIPAGARADAAAVKADANEFTISLVLPANVPAGEVKGLKLSASAAAMTNPGLRVRSAEVELVLVVKLSQPQ